MTARCRRSSMAVAVVKIVNMRMLVLQRSGGMRMGMRFRTFPALVGVLVMLVVDVSVRVYPCFVAMLV